MSENTTVERISALIKVRRDTDSNWSQYNPILAEGEFGYGTTSKQVKIGDGVTTWDKLPALGATSGDPSTPSEDLVDILKDIQNLEKSVSSVQTSLSTVQTSVSSMETQLSKKQETLVSGQNIKTINGVSLLGSGNVNIEGGSGGGATIGSRLELPSESSDYIWVIQGNDTPGDTSRLSFRYVHLSEDGTETYIEPLYITPDFYSLSNKLRIEAKKSGDYTQFMQFALFDEEGVNVGILQFLLDNDGNLVLNGPNGYMKVMLEGASLGNPRNLSIDFEALVTLAESPNNTQISQEEMDNIGITTAVFVDMLNAVYSKVINTGRYRQVWSYTAYENETMGAIYLSQGDGFIAKSGFELIKTKGSGTWSVIHSEI